MNFSFYRGIFNVSKMCYCQRQTINSLKTLTRLSNNDVFHVNYSTQPKSHTNEGFFKSLTKKIPFLDVSKSRLKAAGYFIYEVVADQLNYEEFFRRFDLPDTLYSWFVITELHIWMLSVRAMAEGDDGRYLRNALIQAMWSDVGVRVKKLGTANPAETRAQVEELHEQFQAALIAYDEGLLTSDTVLASALWRRLYQQFGNNPHHLEILVLYVRKQITMLDHLSTEDFIDKQKFKWLPVTSR